MPLFDYLCPDCGQTSEILTSAAAEAPACPSCGGRRLKKLLSAHSTFSGASRHSLPGPGDTACCGAAPGHAGCAGPGSCCGHKAR